jgi:hypothetical protein
MPFSNNAIYPAFDGLRTITPAVPPVIQFRNSILQSQQRSALLKLSLYDDRLLIKSARVGEAFK